VRSVAVVQHVMALTDGTLGLTFAGCSTITELALIQSSQLEELGLSDLHRRRLLRAIDLAKDSAIKDELIQAEALAQSGQIAEAIAQCRATMKMKDIARASRAAKPSRDVKKVSHAKRPMQKQKSNALDNLVSTSEFYCDVTGRTLIAGQWWHRAGSSYDLCKVSPKSPASYPLIVLMCALGIN
jgi:hypothetical protein